MPFRKPKRNSEETKSKKLSEELGEIGLGGDTDETMVDIQKIGSGYVAQVPLSEVKEMYGNIHEYIKQQHGPGDYQIVARKKKSTSTRRLKVAGEIEEDPVLPPTPQSGGINDPSAIAMLLELQRENAQLKAQSEMSRTSNRAEIWEQVIQIGVPFLQGLLTNKGGAGEAAEMMRSTIESIKDLMDISQVAGAGGSAVSGGDDSGLGSIMNAITGFMQMQQQQQAKQQSPVHPLPQTPREVPPKPTAQPNFAQGPSPTPPMTPTPTPQPSPQQQIDPFDEVVSMVELRKEPQEVANYLLSNLDGLSEADVDPVLVPIIQQMQENPLLAWDSLCQMLPSLKEGDYAQKVRTAIETII